MTVQDSLLITKIINPGITGVDETKNMIKRSLSSLPQSSPYPNLHMDRTNTDTASVHGIRIRETQYKEA